MVRSLGHHLLGAKVLCILLVLFVCVFVVFILQTSDLCREGEMKFTDSKYADLFIFALGRISINCTDLRYNVNIVQETLK